MHEQRTRAIKVASRTRGSEGATMVPRNPFEQLRGLGDPRTNPRRALARILFGSLHKDTGRTRAGIDRRSQRVLRFSSTRSVFLGLCTPSRKIVATTWRRILPAVLQSSAAEDFVDDRAATTPNECRSRGLANKEDELNRVNGRRRGVRRHRRRRREDRRVNEGPLSLPMTTLRRERAVSFSLDRAASSGNSAIGPGRSLSLDHRTSLPTVPDTYGLSIPRLPIIWIGGTASADDRRSYPKATIRRLRVKRRTAETPSFPDLSYFHEETSREAVARNFLSPEGQSGSQR